MQREVHFTTLHRGSTRRMVVWWRRLWLLSSFLVHRHVVAANILRAHNLSMFARLGRIAPYFMFAVPVPVSRLHS